MSETLSPRTWFVTAAEALVATAAALTPDDLARPGLGEWDVRALLGHTSRALLTVETYLAAADPGDVATLDRAAGYFAATRGGLADPAAVTQRGRDAGAALGADPAGAVREVAERVLRLVEATPDDAPVRTPVGTMTLAGYLPTRAFELTVHGVDLLRAVDRPVPAGLGGCVAEAVRLGVELAGPDDVLAVLLAVTGRAPLPPSFSLV
jgi:uncharacterized protein (TIGR03083 family)